MKPSDPFWYDIAAQSVQRATERPEGAFLGPFATAEEAAEAPEMLQAYAQSWLDSDEAQPYVQQAKEAGDEPGV